MNSKEVAKRIVGIFNCYKSNTATITGGYLRDLMTGREPKDIDILIRWFSELDFEEIRVLARRFGYSVEEFPSYGTDTPVPEVLAVFKLTKYGELPIDIIFTKDSLPNHISKFPCSASQVWFEEGYIKSTDSFNHFLDSKVLIFTKYASEEYKERIMSYYPDYKVLSA